MSYAVFVGIACMVVGAGIVGYAVLTGPAVVRCTFDRNELGPMGDGGQWYWEVYKCEDGTERRELVASPRG